MLLAPAAEGSCSVGVKSLTGGARKWETKIKTEQAENPKKSRRNTQILWHLH
jgi:hypothetical protein